METWIEHYHLDCKHKEVLINQGIEMCSYGDMSDCENCPFREPVDFDCEVSCTSTEDVSWPKLGKTKKK